MKNTHGGVLILVKLQAKACKFAKLTLLYGCFTGFLNCTNGTKSRNVPHMTHRLTANFLGNMTDILNAQQ